MHSVTDRQTRTDRQTDRQTLTRDINCDVNLAPYTNVQTYLWQSYYIVGVANLDDLSEWGGSKIANTNDLYSFWVGV